MKKEEKKFFDNYQTKSNISYDDLKSNIILDKYQKEKKVFNIMYFKYIILGCLLIAITGVILKFSLDHKHETNEPTPDVPVTPDDPIEPTPDDPVVPGDPNEPTPDAPLDPFKDYTEYHGIVRDDFEKNKVDGPFYTPSGPIPYYTIENVLSSSNHFDRKLNFLYEVEYINKDNDNSYIAVYIEKKKAEIIYTENKIVADAECASPLNEVDGSIVNWFYSKLFYNEEKVKWLEFTDVNKIPSCIGDYYCCGVYKTQTRVLKREIFSGEEYNFNETIFKRLYFQNVNTDYLKPVTYEINNYSTWFISDNRISTQDSFEYQQLFINDYGCQLNVEIKNGRIRIHTYACPEKFLNDELVQDQKLFDFYKETNKYILEEVKEYNSEYFEFGNLVYVIYDYNKYLDTLTLFYSSK